MQITKKDCRYSPPTRKLDHINLKQFTVIVTWTELNCKSNMSVGIKKCFLSAASKCFHGVQRLLKSYLLSRATKLFMYKALTRPVVVHAKETLVIAQ